MLGLFRRVCYEIEKRKYISCLKEDPKDIETRIGLVSWHLKYWHYKEAFEQYELAKGYSKGSRLEELLKAKEMLRSKGYQV